MDIYDVIEMDIDRFRDKDFIFECISGMEYAKKNMNSITYDSFINGAKGFATYLNINGYTGKNILLIGKNSISYMLADFAVTMYVGKCINIDMTTPLSEIQHIADFFHIDLVIFGNELSEVFKDFQKCNKLNLSEIDFSENTKTYTLFNKNPEECSKIFFSSGTTSSPKGIMLSLKNMFAGWNSLQKRTPFTREDVIYLCLPLNHTYANIYNFYYSFLSGVSICLSSETKNMAKEMIEASPSIFCGVPLIYERLIPALPVISKISSLKYLYCGGAKLDISLKLKYSEYGLRILNAYALTETASSFAISYPDTEIEDSSVGTVFEDLDVKIINEEDGSGDILVKGDAVFLGYLHNEEATRKSFTEDGYFITGDKGYVKGNKLYITGRSNERIALSNGENIYLEEIKKWFCSKTDGILDINVYENSGRSTYLFYVTDIEEAALRKLIEDFNSASNKKDRIIHYEIKCKKDKLIM